MSDDDVFHALKMIEATLAERGKQLSDFGLDEILPEPPAPQCVVTTHIIVGSATALPTFVGRVSWRAPYLYRANRVLRTFQ